MLEREKRSELHTPAENMKMSRVVLVLGFVLIMALYLEAQPGALDHIAQPEGCCFNFFTGSIPPDKIQKVKKTGSHCYQQGFIVTTPQYSGLCVREVAVNE
ncbi:hypothetical protein PHYPO_G00227530 [Pangasianodon hypophthalmus]|uniref:Chemokine interleukin-8-like domain-containing protein n=1 Tax=Pangasianodon hypophthalmus TaxID=310915 RepID=A0A5N5NW29_PANHP|nr:hypothetical protein PHYPO_G00227530 [Pangasianodon hypophthalmus]